MIPRYLLCILLLWLPAASFAGTSWEETLAERLLVHYISNGNIQIGVAPQLAGRIVDLRLRRRDHNLLYLAPPQVLGAEPAALAPYRHELPFGGISDVHAPRFSGPPFHTQDYSLELAPDASTITVSATVDDIELIRTMTLQPDTTILQIDITLINRQAPPAPPRSLMARLRGLYNLHLPDDALVNEAEGYITACDPEHAAAMLVRFAPEQVNRLSLAREEGRIHQPQRFAQTLPAGSPGYLRLEVLQQPQQIAPGERLHFRQSHALYSGLTAIDLVHDETLMQLTTSHPVYAQDEPIVVQVAAARPTGGESIPVTLRCADEQEELVVACPIRGVAAWQRWELPPRLRDGTYTVTMEAFGQRVAHTFEVAGKRLGALRQARQQLGTDIAILAARGTLAKQTEARMAAARLPALDDAIANRQLAAAEATLHALREDVDRWLAEAR